MSDLLRGGKRKRAKKKPTAPKVKTIDMAKDGMLLPPAPDKCQQCATAHEPELPHNQQSLFWQYWFYRNSGGKWPTTMDAQAHCSEDVKQRWAAAYAQVMERRAKAKGE